MTWKDDLRPFGELWADMRHTLMLKVEALTDAELERTRRALDLPSRTNCAWHIYGVVPALRDEVEHESLIRKKRRESKPAEPTGLGAVVKDRDGNQWVRVADGTDHTKDDWQRVRRGLVLDSEAGWTRYADIDAVEVLSEGVPA